MKQAYFDTSAIVPLLIREIRSSAAKNAFEVSDVIWTWRWTEIETEAALVRRKANAATWREWRLIKDNFRWLESPDTLAGELCIFNRALGLRAADAGHLYMFERSQFIISELMLVSFDREMLHAAKALNLPVMELD